MAPGAVQILSTVGAQSVAFVSVGLVASRQNAAIVASSGKSLPTQRLPTVVPVVWVNGFAVQAVIIVSVQSVAFVIGCCVCITAKCQPCHQIIRAKRVDEWIIGANTAYHKLAIGGFRRGGFGRIIAKHQLCRMVRGAKTIKRIIDASIRYRSRAIVRFRRGCFGIITAKHQISNRVSRAKIGRRTVVPVVWINLSAAQAVFIVPVQLASFPAGVRLVSRQNTKSATGSAEQRLPTVVPVVWINLSAVQAVFIVPVQSADFVVVVLPVSRQNASRATGSAVQSPLNGLLVQRVVRAVLAGVKYLAKSALFAHAVSNGLVRHGTDLTADSQVDVAAASPARHSVIFISCAVSAAAVVASIAKRISRARVVRCG